MLDIENPVYPKWKALQEKLAKELLEYTNSLRDKPVDSIIDEYAYELVNKREIVSCIEYLESRTSNPTFLQEEQFQFLLDENNLLDFIYTEWLSMDVTVTDFNEAISDILNSTLSNTYKSL